MHPDVRGSARAPAPAARPAQENGLAAARLLQDVPLLLFLVGLNAKLAYDLLEALQVAVVQPLEYGAFGCLMLSGVGSLMAGRLRLFKRVYRVWLAAICVVLCALLMLAMVSGAERYPLSRDLFALSYLSALFIGARRDYWPVLDRVIILQLTVVAAVCWYMIIFANRALIYENLLWSPLYRAWALLYAWEYALATINRGPSWRRAAAASGAAAFLVMSVLAERRNGLLMAALIVAGCVVARVWRFPRLYPLRRLSFRSLAVAAGGLLLTVALEVQGGALARGWHNVQQRFVHHGSMVETLIENYRWTHEVDVVWNTASPAQLVLGRGLGATVPTTQVAAASGETGTLHNGIMNIILKGGLLLAVLLLVGGIVLLKDAIRTQDKHARVCAVVILAAAAISPVQTFLSTSPAWGIKMACAGYLMARRPQIGLPRRPLAA